MKINQLAVAGTLESGDVMIRIAPLDTQDIDLQITVALKNSLASFTAPPSRGARYDVRAAANRNVDDKGALTAFARPTGNATGARASGIAALPRGSPRFPLLLQQRKTRTRMLFVPGANAAMVSNSFIYPADALMFDPKTCCITRKDAARRLVYHAPQHPLYRDVETIVRVNAPAGLRMGVNDSSGRAAARGRGAFYRKPTPRRTSLISKTKFCALKTPAVANRQYRPVSRRGNRRWYNPRGRNRPRLLESADGIALGAEDYAFRNPHRTLPEGTELLFARCAICRPRVPLNGIQAFDTVYSDANNEAGFLQESAHINSAGL